MNGLSVKIYKVKIVCMKSVIAQIDKNKKLVLAILFLVLIVLGLIK